MMSGAGADDWNRRSKHRCAAATVQVHSRSRPRQCKVRCNCVGRADTESTRLGYGEISLRSIQDRPYGPRMMHSVYGPGSGGESLPYLSHQRPGLPSM